MEPMLWAGLLILVGAGLLWLWLRGERRAASDIAYLPSNPLEEMLVRSEADPASMRFREVMLQSRFLAMTQPENPELPAITRAIAPAALCEDVDGKPAVAGSSLALPPVLLCFSSSNVLMTAAPEIRAITSDGSSLREFPARTIIEHAVANNAEVLANPGCAGSRRFNVGELQALLGRD